MKTKFRSLALTCLIATFLGQVRTQAQTELIHDTLGYGEQRYNYFPNEFDLIHEKQLIFDGTATLQGNVPGILTGFRFQFGWLDLNNQWQWSQSFGVPFDPGQMQTSFHQEMIIPFCPEQVALWFTSDVQWTGTTLTLDGLFTHECLNDTHVPDTGGTGIGLATALAALGMMSHRRLRGQTQA